MAKFKLYLLTPDLEQGSYFVDLISSFSGQFTTYNKKREIPNDDAQYVGEDVNYSSNENFSLHTNAQKELSFDLVSKLMINNKWTSNIFIRRLNVGSLVLLIDKYEKAHILIVKNIKTQLNEINTIYSYTCQDVFSYTLTRQNEGYSIINDPASTNFIGAKTIDWWVEKICADCYISDRYVKLNDTLYKGYGNTIRTASNPDSITDSIQIIKPQDLSVLKTLNNSLSLSQQTFSFSCDGSSAMGAILSLCELIGYSLNFYENVSFYSNRVKLSRYFWLEPSKIDNISPYQYSPKKNIESFSFDQSGDSLSTVLNVKSHNIGDEQITLLPTIPPRFTSWFQSENWAQSEYKSGFFTDLLEGKVFTNTGDFPNLHTPDMDENDVCILQSISQTKDLGSNYAIFEGRIWIPIYSNNRGTLELTWWDNKLQLYKEDNFTYFYLTVLDSNNIYNNTSFYCDIRLRLNSADSFTTVRFGDEIPEKFRGKEVQAYITIPQLNGVTRLWYMPKIYMYAYSEVSEEERYFATLADKIPWLENKIIDFSYFYTQGVLTSGEYLELMSKINNNLRIVNGQLLCYAQEYYKAIQTKTELLAELESAAESLHATLQADGISKYTDDGATSDLKEFIFKNAELNRKYKTSQLLYGAREIQNNYLNKYFNSQQRFLKNIYRFREFFNAPVGETTTYYNKYTHTIQRNTGNYISFLPSGFMSCVTYGSSKINDSMTFYTKKVVDGVDVYSSEPVVTSKNYKDFYVTSTTSPSYEKVASGEQYNSINQYFIKGSNYNSEFITGVLKVAYVENQYYPLNETLLKQYYYYCAWDTDICTNFYIKKQPEFYALGSSSSYEKLTVDCLYFYDEDDTEAETEQDKYKKITYKNRFTEGFKSWDIVNDSDFYSLVSPNNGNPYTFALLHNYNNYVQERDSGNANYFISAEAALRSAEQRWNESDDDKNFANSTYDNYWKYRVVCSGYTSPKGEWGYNTLTNSSGQSIEISLYTPKIYYELVFVEEVDGEQVWTDYYGNVIERPAELYWAPNSFVCQWGGATLACLEGVAPILLEKNTEVVVRENRSDSFFQFIDYKKETMYNEYVWKEFYLTPTNVYFGNSLFNPLTMSATKLVEDDDGEKTQVEYTFTDVCPDLYFLTPEKVSYVTPENYSIWQNAEKTIKAQYYIKREDGSYQTVVTLDDVQNDDTGKYYIENSSVLNQEDIGQITTTKTLNLNLYLNEVTSDGVITYKYPKLFKLELSPDNAGNVSCNTVVSITHENKVFTGTINTTHTITVDTNNYSNGDFWYNHITDQENTLMQEKALIIEQQLTEYWTQAYTASKYCDFFIPEFWQNKQNLTENKFFNRLFSVQNNRLAFLPSIPEVSVYSHGVGVKTPAYELIWDPFNTQTTGRSAVEVVYANPAFISLAEELFGGRDSLYKLKVEKTDKNNTYYYVKAGGWRWKDILKQISNTTGEMTQFSGLYGLMFKWSQSFVENTLSTYQQLLQNKDTLWKELHDTYPNLFFEGVFEYPTATSSEELLQMAEYAFKGKSQPEVNYSMTILDVFSLHGYKGEELKIGYPIMVNVSDYQLDNLRMQKDMDQYLFITDITYSLRSDSNINITVNSIKYDDKLIQKLVKLIR